MSQKESANATKPVMPSHRRFAAYYERMGRSETERRYIEPLRRKLLARARGLVLEVGAGNGLNFPIYDPALVERVEAVEPDPAMLGYARERAQSAHVPITLTQAAAEALPFADASFNSVVVTLVFCSVSDPALGLREIRRVLKPDGILLMVEHVRSPHGLVSLAQSAVTPFTRRLCGNCHWNRDTLRAVREAGFQIDYLRDYGSVFLPFILLEARKFPLDRKEEL
jgi:ubiquinone/menaquinone biosynthesis C-methylase UbiE